MHCAAIVLAAGKGTRMNSDKPKVLHHLGKHPIVFYPIQTLKSLGAMPCLVVVGYKADEVKAELETAFPNAMDYVLQENPQGTGHAVSCALPQLKSYSGPVFIVNGDVPFLRGHSLEMLKEACIASESGLALLTFRPDSPHGYGRIVRDHEGKIQGIREQSDASAEEKELRECNAGIYCVQAELLRRVLPDLGRDNAQGEVYLTDMVEKVAAVSSVAGLDVDSFEVSGINTVEQLHGLEEEAIRRGILA